MTDIKSICTTCILAGTQKIMSKKEIQKVQPHKILNDEGLSTTLKPLTEFALGLAFFLLCMLVLSSRSIIPSQP